MSFEILSEVESPVQLRTMDDHQLRQLAREIRQALLTVVADRSAHFASNLGVVELCIALHQVFDFSKDRLIWDTGHQIYPHKLITGRFNRMQTIRRRGGLMGYPNPAESDYDLFMTGHAGSSVSTVLGLKAADDLVSEDERKSVAVIGDGALPSGIVFEAMNNAAGLNKDVLVILNDNKMGICPRVGGVASYLDKARVAPFYNGLKRDVAWLLNRVPVVGESVEHVLGQFKDAVKTFFHGGMLFEEMGFRYIGPVDGHDIASLRQYMNLVRDVKGPVLLHVLTEKGHGFEPACQDPVKFHTPAPFYRNGNNEIVPVHTSATETFTNVVSASIHDTMGRDEQVCVLTAAMCAGNKLEKLREEYPERFFDTGICEGHAVAFAAGMAKAGMKPIVNIYSTFLQRSYDQIFQEVTLQDLPVTFCMDRAGLCGPDGPTHHGVFDISYMRIFPNMVVMAPGDREDVAPMLEFAMQHGGPVALRYPKATTSTIDRDVATLELGKAEVIRWGRDGNILVLGALLSEAVKASNQLKEDGLDVGVINARFAKPVDTEIIIQAVETGFVITLDENVVTGGFGSAVLEAANARGASADRIHVAAIPDSFIEHGDRADLLADLQLDATGLRQRTMAIVRDTVPLKV